MNLALPLSVILTETGGTQSRIQEPMEVIRKLCSVCVRRIWTAQRRMVLQSQSSIFPGDGCDERDQHLVASVNDLSCEEWDATYGNYIKA